MSLAARNGGLLGPDGVTSAADHVARRLRAEGGIAPPSGVFTTPYHAADLMASQELSAWWVSSGSADADLLPGRQVIVDRSRDLVRNNGWAAGAVGKYVDTVVGATLRPTSTPDHRALGISPEQAARVADAMEAAWRLFAAHPSRYCDAARHDTMGGLFGQLFRHYVIDGECLAVLLWRPDRPWSYATTVQVVDPDRLSNPRGEQDTDALRAGVEMDRDGAAVAYHIRRRHGRDVGSSGDWSWQRVPRETPWGRAIVVHHYDRDRAGQSRGVGRLASVVRGLKMLDQYERTEAQAALLNTILAAFIESPMDPALLADALDDGSAGGLGAYQDLRSSFHESRRLTLGGVRIPILAPGEKLGFHTAARPSSQYGEFVAALLRNIAAAFQGLSYESLSMDYSKTNYSSARAGLVEAARTVLADRHAFAAHVATPIWAAVIEEAVDTGLVVLPEGAPGIHEALAAWAACRWIGPPRGWVDPVKEAQAATLRMDGNLSTLEAEAAEQGYDWQDVVSQRARESLALRAAGLEASGPPAGVAGLDAMDDDDGGDDGDDGDGDDGDDGGADGKGRGQ